MKLSVIMPVYNAERFLAEAIESILNQTYRDFEFIIINDGSTDRSEEIIKSYHDDRIVYVKNETNLKLIKTLNKGIDIAKGEFIARMDSDDVSLPDRFERQIRVFEKHPEVDFINGRAYDINEQGFRTGKIWYGPVSEESIKYINLFSSIICHPAVMIKADLLKTYKYRDEISVLHIEDYDLWARLLTDGYICYTMSKPVLNYRIVSTSICRQNGGEQIQHLYKNVKLYMSKIGFAIDDDEIDALQGYRTSYKELSILHKMFSRFIDGIMHGSSKETMQEFNDWKCSRELRLFHQILRNKKYVDIFKSLFHIIIPHLLQYYSLLSHKKL